ncbi:unnamed protein product [Bursaphelenchus xylophilus]|uniref:(pine wood nematode) hypothetical protein n=1 Tax=Bursaphelenchus xylophilus TaxID=6326 RepID=A0A7I8XD58_BURXY|nr:unnamed protein product [Bursaphelenchus xylophilus]CAG9114018.1 unnamed protein product [Bursaphelenchus xylophilus]
MSAAPLGMATVMKPPQPVRQYSVKVIKADISDVECTICSQKPTQALQCKSCQQWVGCVPCVVGWLGTCRKNKTPATCPLCRSSWKNFQTK